MCTHDLPIQKKSLCNGDSSLIECIFFFPSNANGAKQDLTGRETKRARVYSRDTTESESSDPTGSAGDDDASSAPTEETSGTPKEGDAEGFLSSEDKGRNP
jgi:hypothetical protein